MQGYVDYLNKYNNGGSGSSDGEGTGENTGNDSGETISTDENCVGYYVNLDNDKTNAEGIIYIDIARTTSGSWNGYDYTITNVTTGLKDYTVIKEEYSTEEFGTAKLIEAVAGSTGEERFYVMALEDVNPGTYYGWYDAAYDSGISNYSTVTATGIGAGETNTETMIEKWNAAAYGAKNDNGSYADMWGVVEDGWYVPSKDEWAAFGSTLGITSSNYSDKGLRGYYWSSSLNDTDGAWSVILDSDFMYYNGGLSDFGYVRLGTTF